MYTKLMVPLDGSQLAECVLPHLDSIASGCGVKEVTLVRVVPPVSLPTPPETWESYVGQTAIQATEKIEASHKAEANQYLTTLQSRLKLPNVKVTGTVLYGSVADTLADFAKKNNPDLIIIATHGRGGISRWAYGSVADRLLRSACVPVLMVRAPGCIPGI